LRVLQLMAIMAKKPPLLTILGIVFAISGIFAISLGTRLQVDVVLGKIFERHSTLSITIIAISVEIVGLANLIIVWILFRYQRRTREIVINLIVLSIIFSAVTYLIDESYYPFIFIILDVVLIYCLWRPDVVAYFKQ